MKLPRDLSGDDLATLLSRYGYQVTRQSGSHMRLSSVSSGHEHSITIPNHKSLKSGTLSAVLRDVARYLGKTKEEVQTELFS